MNPTTSVTIAAGASFRKCCTLHTEGDVLDVEPLVAKRGKYQGIFVPDPKVVTGGTEGSPTGATRTTETITLTQTRIDNGVQLSGTPTEATATNLSVDSAGGGTVPYGANYTVTGDTVRFAAGFRAQLRPGDIVTIVWS